MNKIYKTLLAAAVAVPALTLTGCIEETFPEGGTVTKDMIQKVPGAADNYALGMPSYLKAVFILPAEMHYDFGYPAMMFIRDTMTGDMPVAASGYDQFTGWRENIYQGPEYLMSQFPWWYYYKLVQTANQTLAAIDKETEDAHLKTLMGYAYGFRAMAYLDLARTYEFLPNDKTSEVNDNGNNVKNLTVPIVTEEVDEALARSNPRAPHEQMSEFILSDLDKAEALINSEARSSKTMPDLACIYGLKARLYMWDENYPKAAEYARMAISASGCTPLSPDEWTSKTDGFNNINSHAWMWGINYVEEDDAVQTAIINPTSWFSNEYVEGYSAVGPYVMMSKSLYDMMRDDDCRKLCFVAPEGSPLAGKEIFIDRSAMINALGDPIDLPPYSSLKFRPGQGNMKEYLVACTVGIPLMRVEEMYFIEAEAIAHNNPTEGAQLLTSFMNSYRCTEKSFTVLGTTTADVVDEIFNQKRIEFFLEGQTFFDIKRLNKPVIRNYEGTNYYESSAFNTTTRPAWMNMCIVRQEENGNNALIGWNNPDPSNAYVDTEGGDDEEE